MKFRTQYTEHKPEDYSFDQTGQTTRTRLSEQSEADINIIMDRFNRTGKLPNFNKVQGAFLDASSAMSYDQALMAVKRAQEAFSTLPAKVRKEFSNNPAELEKFLADPANDKLAVELGLREVIRPSTDDLLTEVVKNTKQPVAKKTEKAD